ncbi:MAG: ABC transporter substrate-binding protein [Actinomycetota bacterium]|nr:ABC transporter substrate-binding protein [Actinomycetota bacterium]
MAYESDAEPIKMGYLMDFRLPEGFPELFRKDLTDPFEHVFQEGFEQGVIDRPVEIVYREVEGLPKGSVKAVIDAYGELVDEGCLLVFGPSITDNCEPTKEAIEERFKVPAISVTGSEQWLGEWTFSLSMGSMSDEPIFWADLIAKRGLNDVGLLVEQSLIGDSYQQSFRRAARNKGLRIVAEELIPQTAKDVTEQVQKLHDAGVGAVVHCGFGFGVVLVGFAMQALDWDPPRFMGTSFQNAWLNEIVWNAMLGWVGIDQYDPENQVGQEFLDRYDERFGRRPEWCVPVVNRDLAVVLLQAFADARPLSPAGVRDAIERVKMFPAASGAPGTRISFGRYMHRGWMGPGYLVARQLDPDGVTAHTVDRFGEA